MLELVFVLELVLVLEYVLESVFVLVLVFVLELEFVSAFCVGFGVGIRVVVGFDVCVRCWSCF